MMLPENELPLFERPAAATATYLLYSREKIDCEERSSDRPILIFYNRYRYRYLYVYVTDNRYSEPIFIYCYKVNK